MPNRGDNRGGGRRTWNVSRNPSATPLPENPLHHSPLVFAGRYHDHLGVLSRHPHGGAGDGFAIELEAQRRSKAAVVGEGQRAMAKRRRAQVSVRAPLRACRV